MLPIGPHSVFDWNSSSKCTKVFIFIKRTFYIAHYPKFASESILLQLVLYSQNFFSSALLYLIMKNFYCCNLTLRQRSMNSVITLNNHESANTERYITQDRDCRTLEVRPWLDDIWEGTKVSASCERRIIKTVCSEARFASNIFFMWQFFYWKYCSLFIGLLFTAWSFYFTTLKSYFTCGFFFLLYIL